MSEEAEILKVTVEGTEIYLRLAGTSIKDALKFLKFIFSGIGDIAKWASGIEDRKLDREIKKHNAETTKMEMEKIKARMNLAAGSMDLSDFIKAFGTEERAIMQIPEGSMDRFRELAEKNGLTYSMLEDLDHTDGYVQAMIPSSQSDIWNEIAKQLQREEMKKNKEKKENIQKEMDETAKEKAEYKSEKKGMEKEGRDKTDPEHYNDITSSIKILENKEKHLKEQLEGLGRNMTGEITLEDYMKTNPKAFDHTDLFHEMQENGIEPKGCEKVSEFLKMPDGNASRYKEGTKDGQGNSINPDGYIVNPDVPDIAVRRDEITKDNKITAYEYTVFETDRQNSEMQKDTAIKFRAEGKTTDEEKVMFIRQINQMAKKKNPDYDPSDRWMAIGSREELEKYTEITKKNEAMNKTNEELKGEFRETMGREQGERILSLAKSEAQGGKNIIEIPEDRLMVKREEGKKPQCYIRSENNMYIIHIEPERIKQDRTGKKILILEKGEHLEVTDRETKKPAGRIYSQKDLSDFISSRNQPAGDTAAISREKGGRKK